MKNEFLEQNKRDELLKSQNVIMHSILTTIKNKIFSAWKIADEVARDKAVETIEIEYEELRHIFGVLVLGSFIGMPSPPMQISLDLMPLMEKELLLMMEKVDTANEPLAQLFSTFDIG
ncbi:MAG: hypothetical protein U9R43_15925 [Thermodesulfobacteriota bacterium]|nr:hypothetical protein [Thermodesulfobacteriota bacterium]